MELSIVVPAFNEESCLQQSVDKIEAYLHNRYGESVDRESEVVLVLEKSSDRTGTIGAELARKYANVRLLANEGKMGKGYSVRRGMLAARGDYRLFTDADLSTPIETVDEAVRQLRGYAVVIGSRRCDGAVIVHPQTIGRRLSGLAFRLMTKYLLRLPYHDTQCGFKGCRGEWAQVLFGDLTTTGFCFDVELLLQARSYLGCAVREMPVIWADSGHSSVSVRRDIRRVWRELWRLRQSYYVQGAIRCQALPH